MFSFLVAINNPGVSQILNILVIAPSLPFVETAHYHCAVMGRRSRSLAINTTIQHYMHYAVQICLKNWLSCCLRQHHEFPTASSSEVSGVHMCNLYR